MVEEDIMNIKPVLKSDSEKQHQEFQEYLVEVGAELLCNILSNGSVLFLKARFEEGGHIERLWFKVEGIDLKERSATGQISNVPVLLSRLECGDSVKVMLNEIIEGMVKKMKYIVRRFTKQTRYMKLMREMELNV